MNLLLSIEVFVLALASTVRPTSLAATYALLSAPQPRRLLLLYVVTGLSFVFLFGVAVVTVFQGAHLDRGHSQRQAIVELVIGLLVLAFALALRSGRIAGGKSADDAPGPGRVSAMLQAHGGRISPRIAAAAGPATHLPGIFYLVALNLIMVDNHRLVAGLIDVALFCAVWFAIPIAAWVTFMFRPELARSAVAGLQNWMLRHSRTIVLVLSFTAGAYLVARGLVELL